jgi:5-methylcytosine-specific restriction endonuclease McrA
MPANPALYPADWPAIAQRIKEAADWKCQECDMQCYRPGSLTFDHRFVLTVHHIDHNPGNCDDDNLIALCAPCHLRADAQHHARNAKRTRARRAGQLWLSSEWEAL